MTKAIFVLDEMPQTCHDCQFCESVDYNIREEYFCQACRDMLTCNIYAEKDNKCPLKEMPEKKKEVELKEKYFFNDFKDAIKYAFYKSYNKCIDEILGGNYD